jgi:hypothetical protein
VLLGHGDGTYDTARSFLAGAGPAFVVARDFDHDTIVDLVTANYGGASVSLLRGVGDGTFLSPQSFPVGGVTPNCLDVGDFNADGELDLAVAVFGENTPTATTISVLLGTGAGAFQPPQLYGVQRGPLWIAVGEFDGDGVSDLATANFGVDTVSVLLGNGNGTFQTAVSFPAGSGTASVVPGHFNNDGYQDLVIVNYREPFQILMAPGNGDGTFGAAIAFAVGPSPATASAADFNGDGALDLAVPNWGWNTGNTVSLLLGHGNGSFHPAQTLLAGRGVLGVAAEDLNGDGRPDLALSNFGGDSVSVLLTDGPS